MLQKIDYCTPKNYSYHNPLKIADPKIKSAELVCTQDNLFFKLLSVRNVPIVTAWNPKGLNGHPRIRHASPAIFKVGKGPNGVQDANLKAIHIAHLVVYIDSGSILKPIVQPRTGRFCQWNQKGSLFGFVALFAINLVHLIQIVIGMGIVEPVPKEGGKDNFYRRKAHVFLLCQYARVS